MKNLFQTFNGFTINRKTSQIMAVFASLLMLSACTSKQFYESLPVEAEKSASSGGPAGPSVPQSGSSVTDDFPIPTQLPNKIDMLFMVDNSGSMQDNQTILANSMSSFISQFVNKGFDYQLGLVTSDVENPNISYTANTGIPGLPNFASSGPGNLVSRVGGTKIVKNTTSDPSGTFAAMAKVGTGGSGAEQGLQALNLALSASKLASGGANAGLVREEALLAIVVISDEDECTDYQTALTRAQNLQDRVIQLKTNNKYSFSFIVNTTASASLAPAGCVTSSQMDYPFNYIQAKNEVTGSMININNDFSSDLINLGGSLIDATQKQYRLSGTPANPSAIVVKIDGVTISNNASNGWTYVAAQNSIQLNGTALSNNLGKNLKVSYTNQ